jgi:hypothetical protein
VDQLFFPSFMAKMESSTSEKALAAAASLSPSCCECPVWGRGQRAVPGVAGPAWWRAVPRM